MNFGEALSLLKAGRRAARDNWNGKGMWVELVPRDYAVAPTGLRAREYLAMKTVDDQFVPWVASQTDLLAEDWKEVK